MARRGNEIGRLDRECFRLQSQLSCANQQPIIAVRGQSLASRQILEGHMPESQVSWKVWVVISVVTAGITPLVMELLPPIASAISKQWHPSTQCIAVVSQPHLPLKIHQAPTLKSMVSVWAQQGSDAQVTVIGERHGWYRVSDPARGWVESDRITAACLKAF